MSKRTWIAVLATAGCLSVLGIPGSAGSVAEPCFEQPYRSLVIVSLRTAKADCSFPAPDHGSRPLVSDGAGGWFVGCCEGSGIERLKSDGRVDASWRAGALPGDGRLHVLARIGDTLYAGGEFGVEAIDASTGQRLWLTGIRAGVQQVVPKTGYRVPRPGVLALAVGPSTIYVGGGFTHVGDIPVENLAALDRRTGALVRGWSSPRFRSLIDGVAPDPVRALALAGRTLFFATGEDWVDGVPPSRPIKALDAATGRLLAWRVRARSPGQEQIFSIYGLYVVRENLCAAVAPRPVEGHGGCVNIRTGRLQPWPLHFEPRTFAAKSNVLYAGGENGEPRGMGPNSNIVTELGAIDLTTWRATGWHPSVSRWTQINEMAVSGNRVLLAGGFSTTLG